MTHAWRYCTCGARIVGGGSRGRCAERCFDCRRERERNRVRAMRVKARVAAGRPAHPPARLPKPARGKPDSMTVGEIMAATGHNERAIMRGVREGVLELDWQTETVACEARYTRESVERFKARFGEGLGVQVNP
jgi:hypothetical protein